MKKFTLFFIFFYFIFNIEGNAYSDEKKSNNKRKEIPSEWLKDKTVNDLLRNGFGLYQGNGSEITTTENSVQYHLGTYIDGKFQMVICLVDVKKTICKLP